MQRHPSTSNKLTQEELQNKRGRELKSILTKLCPTVNLGAFVERKDMIKEILRLHEISNTGLPAPPEEQKMDIDNEAEGEAFKFQNLPMVLQVRILEWLDFDEIMDLRSTGAEVEYDTALFKMLHTPNRALSKIKMAKGDVLLPKEALVKLDIRPSTTGSTEQFCFLLHKIMGLTKQDIYMILTPQSPIAASTRDAENQDIDKTVDGHHATFWSSDGAETQDKSDFLIYDLGDVALIRSILIIPFLAFFHDGNPTYGFQSCWFEVGFTEDEFHYKSPLYEDNPNTSHPNVLGEKDVHPEGGLVAGRFIKIWLRGCHQKQHTDDLWYFAINKVQVRALPYAILPPPFPTLLDRDGVFDASYKSKRKKWFEERYKVQLDERLRPDLWRLLGTQCVIEAPFCLSFSSMERGTRWK